MNQFKYQNMRKILSEHFCAAAFNQSQFVIPDSDPRWRRSDVVIFCRPHIVGIGSKMASRKSTLVTSSPMTCHGFMVDPYQQGRRQTFSSSEAGFHPPQLQRKPRRMQEIRLSRPSALWAWVCQHDHLGPYLQKEYYSIERAQWKAAQWVTSSYDRRTSVTKLLKDLQWDSRQERRRQQRLVFMYKILNHQVAVPANSIDLTYSSRPVRGDKNKKKLFQPRTNTTDSVVNTKIFINSSK